MTFDRFTVFHDSFIVFSCLFILMFLLWACLCLFFVPCQVFGGANGVDIHMRILAKTTRSQGAHPRSSDLSEKKLKDIVNCEGSLLRAVPGCGGKALWNRWDLNASFGFKVINSDCLTVRIYIIFGFFYPILVIDRLHYLFWICCLSSQVTTTLHEHQMTLLRCHEDLRQHHQNEKSVLQDLQVCWMCRWTWMGWAKVPWCFIIYPMSTQNIPKWKHNFAGWHYDISISIEIGHPSYYSTIVLLFGVFHVFHDKGEEGAAQGGPPWQDVCPAYRDFAAKDCQLASQSYRLKSLNFVRALRIWTASRMRPHASTANQAQPSADSVCPKLWRLTTPKSQRVWMQDLRSTPNVICHTVILCEYEYNWIYIYMTYFYALVFKNYGSGNPPQAIKTGASTQHNRNDLLF